MTRGFNKVILAGNLTRDPEMRTTTNGHTVCTFAIAVNRTYRDANGNNQEEVSFFDCSIWGRGAEIVNQYAHKGSGMLISGRLTQRSWEDKDTGKKRSRVEVVVEDFNFLSNDRDGASRSYNGENSYTNSSDNNYDSDSSAGTSETPASDTATGEVVPDDIPENIDLQDIPF